VGVALLRADTRNISLGTEMKIAKIVSSNSHIDYAARVIDALDVEQPPSTQDYGFGQFVSIGSEDGQIIGIVYDSQIINPEYANFGPRLSPRPALGSFSPDFLNEQGILLGILLLGQLGADNGIQGVPRTIVPAGADVSTIDTDAIDRFHRDKDGAIHLHYYSLIIANAGSFAAELLASIVGTLSRNCGDEDRQKLSVLRRSVDWHGTFGSKSF
jgi:hypothetical protein